MINVSNALSELMLRTLLGTLGQTYGEAREPVIRLEGECVRTIHRFSRRGFALMASKPARRAGNTVLEIVFNHPNLISPQNARGVVLALSGEYYQFDWARDPYPLRFTQNSMEWVNELIRASTPWNNLVQDGAVMPPRVTARDLAVLIDDYMKHDQATRPARSKKAVPV